MRAAIMVQVHKENDEFIAYRPTTDKTGTLNPEFLTRKEKERIERGEAIWTYPPPKAMEVH